MADKHTPSEKLERAETKVRTVTVPVYLSIPVLSDDDCHAECEAIRIARAIKMSTEHGEITVPAVIAPMSE